MGLGLVEISAVDKAIAEKLQPRPVASSGRRRSREAAMRSELEGKAETVGKKQGLGGKAALSRSPGKILGLILRAVGTIGEAQVEESSGRI